MGLFLIYPTVNAAGLVPCGRNTGTPEEMRPCTTCDLFALASRIMNFVLFTIVPAVAVLFYLIGGLMILLSRGSPGLVATGKNFFWNTTWGLVIIFGAWMLTNTVLKSLVGDSDISNNWYSIQCINPPQLKPPSTQRYNCSSENICVANPNGPYTEPTCDNKCAPAQTFYICDQDTNQCRVDPEGNATDSYTTSNCDNECAPAQRFYTCNDGNQCVEDPEGEYDASNCDNECQSLPVPVTISTSSLSDAIVNQSYAQPVNASGGVSPLRYLVSGGSLPPGLTLSTNGIIAGTPTTASTYTFTVKVEDSTTPTKQSATKELSIGVNPAGPLACLFSGINLCQGQPLKLSGGKLIPDSKPVCGTSTCSQYISALTSAAQKTGISLNLLKATIYKESACQINAANIGGNSYGLMQMQPGTANTFRSFCGVTQTITSSWLTNPANAAASICIAAYFYKSLADGYCGYSPRNILAGYSAGPGRCQPSRDCASDKSCSGETVRQWECLYDNPQHTVCNGDNTVIGAASKLNETRYSVVNKLYCVDNPGF